MYLYLVAQLAQLVMDVFLFWPGFLVRPLELNEQRATTRYPEDAVWVACVARRHELRTDDPQVLPHEVDGLPLDLGLENPHSTPLRSATDWQCTQRTRPISMRSSGMSPPQSKQVMP